MKNINFNLYRYQLLPKDRHFQGALFEGAQTIEELIANKNKFFLEIIISIEEWKNKRGKINSQLIYNKDNFLLFRFAPRRTARLENETFEEEQHENWPSILVAIWNEPDKQYILIQDRKQAFVNTESVLNIMLKSINISLTTKQLKIYAEPIFHKEAFWNIVNTHHQLIKNIKFELITPNMANISDTLSEDLKSLAKGTNTAKTLLEIDADDSILHIEENDKQVSSLVDYASEGGGNISVKISGIRKRIQTANSVKLVEIGEIEVNSENTERIVDLLKKAVTDE